MMGFSPRWASWIQQVTSKRSIGIKVNDNIEHCLQTKKLLGKAILYHIFFSILWQMSLLS
jgi:hypothetical protein